MENRRLQRLLTYAPFVLVVGLTVIYGLFLNAYMECRWPVMGCEKLNVARIYVPASDVLNHYPDDRSQSIGDVEKQLQQKAEQKSQIASKRAQKGELKDQLQGQVVDAALVLKEKSSGLEPADGKKLEDSLKTVEKAKAEVDDSVELLSSQEKKLDDEITALNARLGELHNREIQRYTQRLTWILFSGMFVVACAGVLVVALVILSRIEVPLRRGVILLLVILILVAYASIRFYFDAGYTSTFERFVALLDNGSGDHTVKLVNFFDALGNIAVFALLIAATGVLWHRKRFFNSEPENRTSKLNVLVQRKKYLRLVLYAGTIILVIGILRVRVLLDWLLTYSVQPALQASVDDFNKLIISSLGVFYSLLLVAVYVPGRFIIIDRAQSLAGVDEAALQTAGLSSSSTLTFKEFLPRIAALLGPLLVGPVAELIKTALQ